MYFVSLPIFGNQNIIILLKRDFFLKLHLAYFQHYNLYRCILNYQHLFVFNCLCFIPAFKAF